VLAGVLQIIAGLLKAGVVGYYFPSSVIKGMLAAIGLILIMKEIPHVLGYDKDFMGDEAFDQPDRHNTLTELWYAVRYSSTGAMVISAVSLGMLLLFERPFMQRFGLFRFLPGALFVVVVGTSINLAFRTWLPQLYMSGEHLVQLPLTSGAVSIGDFIRLPDFSGFSDPQVYVVALTLAVVASLESLLSVEATDKLDPQRRNTDTNRELLAQGAGNMISGLLGGLPVTQVIVRSSANINSGARTKMSAMIHGLILITSALLIPSLLNHIPLAALACILLMVGYKLSRVTLYRDMCRLGWNQFLPFLVTVVAILLTDLLKGIGIGMVVAVYFILLNNYQRKFTKHSERCPDGSEIMVLALPENVTFLNKGSMQRALDQLPDNSRVVIDGTRSMNIDFDVLEIIQNFRQFTAPMRKIHLSTRNIPEVSTVGAH
jgi:MFS superfamily sulfate permease-like transporter